MTQPDLRRLLRARRIGRRIRSVWQRVRPFPLPRYVAGTPRVGGSDRLDLYFPPTALTLGAAAMSEKAVRAVLALLQRSTPTEESAVEELFYRWAQGKFGEHWRYANLYTALWAASTLTKPTSYLEIGVRRGRGVAVVGATCRECAIYGFDLWIPDYGAAPNPGPDFVRGELRAVGHSGTVVLESGDSRKTVPAFLRRHSGLYFDLITIDGDKSLLGVASDFANALPRLKVGGIVISDDAVRSPIVKRVWEKVIKRDGRYEHWDFFGAGSGVAAAIRVADEAPLPPWVTQAYSSPSGACDGG